MALKINNVTGGYFGNPVLEDVSFEIADGELVGLIGLNGAGKSTTIQEIMGLLTPYSGQIELDGITLQEDLEGYRKKIGFIPETPSLYEELTLREHIELTALAYGVPGEEAMPRAEELLKTFRLEDKLDWFPVNFSKGMKQKVGIVVAFMHDPDILILDEPTSGLDPLMQNEFVNLILEEKKRGKTILMSSHIFEEVEKTCNRVGIIKQGKIVSIEDIDTLRKSLLKTLKILIVLKKKIFLLKI